MAARGKGQWRDGCPPNGAEKEARRRSGDGAATERHVAARWGLDDRVSERDGGP